MTQVPYTHRTVDGASSIYGAREWLRCLSCGRSLRGLEFCGGCGREYPDRRGIITAMDPLEGRNRIAATFYDGPGWKRFRRWERLFLTLQGGQRLARRAILRHLPQTENARVLEVGIGDGDNLPWLPRRWEVIGVDIARSRMAECVYRFPFQAGRLVLAEAEALPFDDGSFDACFTVGGFNFFGDHERALREMRRVAKPGGVVIVADEAPWLRRLGIGHLLGAPALDGYWLRGLGLDRDFASLVLGNQLNLKETLNAALPGAQRYSIWGGLGYCCVQMAPSAGDGRGE
jgi:SAM-dependent methyltransferase